MAQKYNVLQHFSNKNKGKSLAKIAGISALTGIGGGATLHGAKVIKDDKDNLLAGVRDELKDRKDLTDSQKINMDKELDTLDEQSKELQDQLDHHANNVNLLNSIDTNKKIQEASNELALSGLNSEQKLRAFNPSISNGFLDKYNDNITKNIFGTKEGNQSEIDKLNKDLQDLDNKKEFIMDNPQKYLNPVTKLDQMKDALGFYTPNDKVGEGGYGGDYTVKRGEGIQGPNLPDGDSSGLENALDKLLPTNNTDTNIAMGFSDAAKIFLNRNSKYKNKNLIVFSNNSNPVNNLSNTDSKTGLDNPELQSFFLDNPNTFKLFSNLTTFDAETQAYNNEWINKLKEKENSQQNQQPQVKSEPQSQPHSQSQPQVKPNSTSLQNNQISNNTGGVTQDSIDKQLSVAEGANNKQAGGWAQKLGRAATLTGNTIKNSGGFVKAVGQAAKDSVANKINSVRHAIGGAKDKVVNGVKNFFTGGVNQKAFGEASKECSVAYQQSQRIQQANQKLDNLKANKQTPQPMSFKDKISRAWKATYTDGSGKALKDQQVVNRNSTQNTMKARQDNRNTYNQAHKDIRNATRTANNNYKFFSDDGYFNGFAYQALENFANTNPIFEIEHELITAWNNTPEYQQMFSDYYSFEEYVITNYSDMDYVHDYLSQFEPIINFASQMTIASNNEMFNFSADVIEDLAYLAENPINFNDAPTSFTKDINKGVGADKYNYGGYGLRGKHNNGLRFNPFTEEKIKKHGRR